MAAEPERFAVVAQQPAPTPRPKREGAAADDWVDQERASVMPRTEMKRLDVLIGLELGPSLWSADANKIITGASTGFDFSRYGPAFTSTIDGHFHAALNLHGGLRFLRFAAVEAAFQSSISGSSGALLAGGRATAYPLQALQTSRAYDLGIEVGAGYAFVMGPPYDMSGSYFSLGLTGEYPVTKWLRLQVFYRLVMSFLGQFYPDYAHHITEPVDGFTAYWNTIGVGAIFRLWSKE